VALPFTLKSILRQKKNNGNSNISPYKNIIFQKSSLKNRPIRVIRKVIRLGGKKNCKKNSSMSPCNLKGIKARHLGPSYWLKGK
jgi:hypothetical protein